MDPVSLLESSVTSSHPTSPYVEPNLNTYYQTPPVPQKMATPFPWLVNQNITTSYPVQTYIGEKPLILTELESNQFMIHLNQQCVDEPTLAPALVVDNQVPDVNSVRS